MKPNPQHTYNTTQDEATINLIKIQNKKLASLFTQLDNKDLYIKKIESKLATMSNLHHQNMNLQNQLHHMQSHLTTIEQDNAALINKASTIQSLNDTSIAQNNKINELLTRVNDLNTIITNQDNTIKVLTVNKDSIQDKCMKDKTEFEQFHQEECRRLTEDIQEKEMLIANYQSKLNQCEYLLNDKMAYQQNCNEEFNRSISQYEEIVTKIIEWAVKNIGIKDRSGSKLYHIFDSSSNDYQNNTILSNINDILIKTFTTIHHRVNEEYLEYEKELETQQNSYSSSIEQIKEMSNRIKSLEKENINHKEHINDSHTQFASNSVHYKQELQCLVHRNKSSEKNIEILIEQFLQQYIEDLPILSSINGSEHLLPTIQHIELSKATNPIQTISSFISNLIDYCKWVINDTKMHYISQREYTSLQKDNTILKEANASLKKTIQSNLQQYSIEKQDILTRVNHCKEKEVAAIEKALNDEVNSMKEFMEDYQEENERVNGENKELRAQYKKIEKMHEEYKKNQGEYEEHLQLQNEDLSKRIEELEGIIMKLKTDVEIGSMQMGSLKNALQEQININEQTRETMTNYTTTIH